MWVLSAEPWSSATAPSALSCRAISPTFLLSGNNGCEGFFPANRLTPVYFLYFLSHLLLISNVRIILGLHHSWVIRLGWVGSPSLIWAAKGIVLVGGRLCLEVVLKLFFFLFPFSLHVLNLHRPALATVPGPIHASRVGQCRHVTFRCRILNPTGQHFSESLSCPHSQTSPSFPLVSFCMLLWTCISWHSYSKSSLLH